MHGSLLSLLSLFTPLRWFVIPVAMVLSSALVWNATDAAFTGTTDNSSNAWTAGSISISDDDSGTAMFSATGLKPGSTGSRCIVVTYNSVLSANVRLYAPTATLTTTNGLSSYIDLTIQEATSASASGTFASSSGGGCTLTSPTTLYTGTLANLSTKATYANGVSTWAPTGTGQSRIYKITYTLNASAPDSTQSGTAGARFVWEAQST